MTLYLYVQYRIFGNNATCSKLPAYRNFTNYFLLQKKNIYQGIIVYTIELLSSTSSMSMLNMDIVLAE